MKIKEIKLKNFRQFLDLELNFSTDKNKNVTVILAENSTGKTTLMQSIKWCLYGDELTNLDNKKRLLNFYIKNTSNKEKELISVEVKIEEENVDYIIKREREVFTRNDNLSYEKLSIEYQDNEGETHIISEDVNNSTMHLKKINRMINQILNKEMSGYFLFDGERINNLGSNNAQSRRDIKNAINAINGFSVIENSVASLNQLERIFKKDISAKLGDRELHKKDREIKNSYDNQKKLESDLQKISDQINESTAAVSNLDNDLIHYNDVNAMVRERSKLERKTKSDLNTINDLRKSLLAENTVLRQRSLMLALHEKYKKVKFNQEYEEKTISNMHAGAIDEIISRGVCICGTPLAEEHKHNLLAQRNYQPPISNAQLIKDFDSIVEKYTFDINTLRSNFNEKRKLYFRMNDDVLTMEKEISELNSKINQHDSKDIKRKNELRQTLNKELRNLHNQQILYQKDIGDLNKRIKLAKTDYDKMLLERDKNLYNQIKLDLIQEGLDFLNDKNEKDRKSRQEQIELLANKHFNEIIYKNKTISLSDTFEYSVKEEDGSDASPSEGERVAISMSLILAIIDAHKQHLMEVNKDEIDYINKKEFSLILDAAFATLDDEFSKAISEKLPYSVEQIILFSTKRQYKGTVEQALSDNIGAKYVLSIPEKDELKNAITSNELEKII